MNEVQWARMDAGIWGLVVLGMVFGFIWLAWWRRSRLERMNSVGPLAEQLDSRGGRLLASRAIVTILGASLLVVALMRPQHGTKATQLKNLGIDIAIALDASKSMKVNDIVPDRMQAAMLEINRLMSGLHGGRVGLVPFAGLAFVQTPLTSDFQVVRTYLQDLRVEDMPRGGTAIGRAIIEGIRVLIPPEALEDTMAEESGDEALTDLSVDVFDGANHKALILFTDGDDHEGEPVEAARLAERLGIKIFTVGVGTSQGRPVPIVNTDGEVTGTMKAADGRTPMFSELNEGLLREVAHVTGGEYFSLGPKGMGEGLLRELDKLEKQEYDATFNELRDDRFQFAVVPALLLLLFEAFMSGRRRRRRGREV